MRGLLSFVLGLAVAFPPFAAAQDAAPTRVPTPQPGYLKTLEIKADIAERNYLTDNSIENLSQFVGSMQRIITAICFGSLRKTLQYSGYPEDEQCRTLIKKVLALDGNNPVALCAQNGIDSRECRESWDPVKIGSYSPGSGAWYLNDRTKRGSMHLTDLTAALRERALDKNFEKTVALLDKQATSAKAAPADGSLRAKYEDTLQDTLKAVCGEEELVLDTVQEVAASRGTSPEAVDADSDGIPSEARSSSSKSGDPFMGVLESLDKGRPTPVPTVEPLKFEGPNYLHYRLNPSGCDNYLQKGQAMIPTSPVVICYREGGVSPSCIDSRRRHPSKKPGAPEVSNSFSSF